MKWFVVVTVAFSHAVTSAAIWCHQGWRVRKAYVILKKASNGTKALLTEVLWMIVQVRKTVTLWGRKRSHTSENRDKELKSQSRAKPTQTAGCSVVFTRDRKALRWDQSQGWQCWALSLPVDSTYPRQSSANKAVSYRREACAFSKNKNSLGLPPLPHLQTPYIPGMILKMPHEILWVYWASVWHSSGFLNHYRKKKSTCKRYISKAFLVQFFFSDNYGPTVLRIFPPTGKNRAKCIM